MKKNVSMEKLNQFLWSSDEVDRLAELAQDEE
jgi:hypothetical protein